MLDASRSASTSLWAIWRPSLVSSATAPSSTVNVLHRGSLSATESNTALCVVRAADHGHRAAVAHDPLDLVGRRRLVDGDRGAARRPDGVVEVGELDARGMNRQTREPGSMPRLMSPAASSHGRDELCGGHVDEPVRGPVRPPLREALPVVQQCSDDVVVRPSTAPGVVNSCMRSPHRSQRATTLPGDRA